MHPLHAENVAIAGGGCAGLSLALALAEAEPELPITLLEPRRAGDYANDRTWCWWDVEPTGFEALCEARWTRWKTRRRGREALHESRRHAYHRLEAARFYSYALERLSARPNVRLRLGEPVRRLHEAAGRVRVESERDSFTVDHVFDSRPSPEVRAARLWQHFLGVELLADTPAFDPHTVTLMDFDLPLDGLQRREPGLERTVAGFAYVLPESPHRALVELTFLSPAPFAEGSYRDALARYLDARHGLRRWRELRVERGRIPMDADIGAMGRTEGAGSITRIGTSGGAVRASSGYAFAGIQRRVRRLVAARAGIRSVGAAPRPPSPGAAARHTARAVSGSPWSPGARAMDRLFLATIERHPELAPDCFHALFERTAPDVLLRFLCDRASFGDRLRVAAALPKAPFARTLLGSARRRPDAAESAPNASARPALVPRVREGFGE